MLATGSTQQEAAKTPTVEVVFDPSRVGEDPISIKPEIVRTARGEGAEVEFVLKTMGGGAQKATFPEQGSILLKDERAGEAELKTEPTRVKLRTVECSTASNPGPLRLPYHVQVEFEGQVYTSKGYPVVEEQGPIC